ncbi:MAG: hypothetical protein HQ475_13070 [SAR202 cluster bacterium]|nr:hypothetical protein [SAR202 cluster bacterium]
MGDNWFVAMVVRQAHHERDHDRDITEMTRSRPHRHSSERWNPDWLRQSSVISPNHPGFQRALE